MKQHISITFFVLTLFAATNIWARPLKGFNEGPYLCVEGGLIQADFDRDEQTGIKIGNDFEPTVGIIFGWNLWDWFSAELEGRYGTNINGDKREHLVGANVTGKYFFILDALTSFESLRIMPTVKGGFAFRVASLPGDPNSNDQAVTTFGWGPAVGGGISFLWKKYLSFGINVQEDLLFFKDIRQDITINGAASPNTLIYKGGFIPQFSAMGFVGVHY